MLLFFLVFSFLPSFSFVVYLGKDCSLVGDFFLSFLYSFFLIPFCLESTGPLDLYYSGLFFREIANNKLAISCQHVSENYSFHWPKKWDSTQNYPGLHPSSRPLKKLLPELSPLRLHPMMYYREKRPKFYLLLPPLPPTPLTPLQ